MPVLKNGECEVVGPFLAMSLFAFCWSGSRSMPVKLKATLGWITLSQSALQIIVGLTPEGGEE